MEAGINVEEIFNAKTKNLEDDSEYATAAIETLEEVLKNSKPTTLREVLETLRKSIKEIYFPENSTDSKETSNEDRVNVKKYGPDDLPLSVISACELFGLYITLSKGALENPDMDKCLKIIQERARHFLKSLQDGRDRLPKFFLPTLRNGGRYMTYSLSNTVVRTLTQAAEKGLHFTVYVATGAPRNKGDLMATLLRNVSKQHDYAITVHVIPDVAVPIEMEKVNGVIVGAESVTANGGILNHTGTFNLALAAAHFKKPVYVLAESYKFMQMFPVNQADVPRELERFISHRTGKNVVVKPYTLDYTPPEYISMIYTDAGAFTTAAVSERLLELYT
ncbi:translation initiation factor eIF-2B subunit alpha [Neocloeon triangulifer]|uniref:translation initiation factor eIF-2B subunit alpha n=1 Tax=Neocloeon triangulifer TaxID=2078957 RepID=UPI00286F2C3D|nr:translation initiation factor eIF-2B subunit alpha [Neocloeon triangulifer]